MTWTRMGTQDVSRTTLHTVYLYKPIAKSDPKSKIMY